VHLPPRPRQPYHRPKTSAADRPAPADGARDPVIATPRQRSRSGRMKSNLPSALAPQAARRQRLTCPRQPAFAARYRGLVSGQLSGNGRLEQRSWRPGFLLPFGRRPSLFGHPVPATEFGSPYGRFTGARAPDLDEFSVFRTREMRLGKGVLYTSGTAVPTRPRMLHDRRLPHHSGPSLISPVLYPGPGSHADEASSRISG
jgi:hypothetical protein